MSKRKLEDLIDHSFNPGKKINIKFDNAELSCPICKNITIEPTTLSCGHTFCMECLKKSAEDDTLVRCPTCNARLMINVSNFTLNKFINAILMQIEGYTEYIRDYMDEKNKHKLIDQFDKSPLFRYMANLIMVIIYENNHHIHVDNLFQRIQSILGVKSSQLKYSDTVVAGFKYVFRQLLKNGVILIFKDIIFRRAFHRSVLEVYVRDNLSTLSSKEIYYLMGYSYNDNLHTCPFKEELNSFERFYDDYIKFLKEYAEHFNRSYHHQDIVFCADKVDEPNFVTDFRYGHRR